MGGAGGQPPLVPVCGDGWRDVASEHCDDGDLAADDACGAMCEATDLAVGSGLRLGRGPHVIAGSSAGIALGLLSDDASPLLSVAFLDAKKHSLGPPEVVASNGVASYLPDPALAPLPDGTFALAYADIGGDGDGVGVALRKIEPGLAPGPMSHANATTLFNQEDPDLIWAGGELVAAWIDGSDDPWGDVVVRTFDVQLAPTSGEMAVSADASSDARPTLAGAAGGGWAVAWRSSEPIWGVKVWASTGGAWSVAPCGPAAPEERPALVELTDGKLLVVCSVLTGVASTSSELRFALIDVQSPDAALQSSALVGMGALEPALARVGDRVVLVHRVATPPGDPLFDDVVWRAVTYDAATDAVAFGPALSIPRSAAHQAADQLVPVAAATPYWPEGAALFAWEDWGGVVNDVSVLAALVPLPETGVQP
jgi:cysteine-rich repeat protein